MIDIESEVYARVKKALKAKFPKIRTYGEYTPEIGVFPAAIIIQADSTVYQRARTTNIENADRLMFEIFVYSNKQDKKKQEAKAIMEEADKAMAQMGFTRISCVPASNIANATIYQLISRYEGVVDKDLWVYTN